MAANLIKETFFTWGEPKICQRPSIEYAKKITVGDINSFFMLFFDNFSSLLSILAEMIFIPLIVLEFNPMGTPVGIGSNSGSTVKEYYDANAKVVWTKMCPGLAVALLVGNIWYAAMAMRLAGKENRMDVTALPYGINTPAGFLTVFMVQLAIMFSNNPRAIDISPDEFADKVWKGACATNFIGGLFEVCGIFLGPIMRKHIPRAALFAPIVGVGFVWLGFNPIIDVMREPFIGFIPLLLTFSGFFSNGGKGIYPSWLPIALVQMVVGTFLWWLGASRHDTEKRELNDVSKMREIVAEAYDNYGFKNEMSAFDTLGFAYLQGKFVAIVFPIALASFIETIENVEMAALKGDSYNVKEAMLADGLGTMLGACFGATIPTTVYIGHVRHKAAGARWFYSFLNALAYFFLLMSGLMAPLFYAIDQTSVGCILVAVGLMIVQTAMEVSASRHYPALMIGLMFVIADMLYFDHFDETVRVSTRSIGRMKGVMNMAPGGGIMCSLIVTAILCDVVDSRYGRATIYCLLGSFFSFIGVMHGANYVRPNGLIIPAIGTSDADFYTTDLGEITFSLPVQATHLTFQEKNGEPVGVGYVPTYAWQYRVEDLGFQDPFRCTPWDRNYAGNGEPNCMVCGDFAWGFAGAAPAYTTVAFESNLTDVCYTETHLGPNNGAPVYGKQAAFEPNTSNGRIQAHPYNEGWRFGLAYAALAIICYIHKLVGAKYFAEGVVVLDNGYAAGAPEVEPAEKQSSTSISGVATSAEVAA